MLERRVIADCVESVKAIATKMCVGVGSADEESTRDRRCMCDVWESDFSRG